MNESIRNLRIVELYKTGDYTMTKLGENYSISRERIRQVLERNIGKQGIVDVKNLRKVKVAEKMRNNYIKTLK